MASIFKITAGAAVVAIVQDHDLATDLDKLEMTIETNGAIGPEDALREAVRILPAQLAVFGTIHQDTGADAAPAEEDEDGPPPRDPILLRPVDDL